MSWQGIHGHDEVVERFRRALARGRLASSFLFVGPPGVGKCMLALALARALLCRNQPESALEPCGECPSCIQAKAGTHPDIHYVAKPKDKAFLPVDLLIGDREHRMREGLCHEISLKPYLGGRKVAIIDDADFLRVEGANCLLKTLEEPPPRSVLILIGTSPATQLPTIRSRCQLVRFRPLPSSVLAELLVYQGVVTDPEEARQLAEHSDGSLRKAMEQADPALWAFRQTLLERLADPVFESVRLAKAVSTFVDEAGKEASLRRNRLRQVVGFAAEFYRGAVQSHCGSDSPREGVLAGALARGMEHWPRDAAAACLDRCLDAEYQISRNANQTTLIECWLDDLARLGGQWRG